MLNISELVNQFVDKNHKRQIFDERRAVALWSQVNNEIVTKATRSINIQNGVLLVRMDNAALRFELSIIRADIIKRLNEELGNNVVKDIVIQ